MSNSYDSRMSSRFRPLAPGALVGVFQPAGPADRNRLDQGLGILGTRYRVLGPRPRNARTAPYLAGSDEERLEELRELLVHPDVACLWAARGGYGCLRILTRLAVEEIRSAGKLLVGFSDLTVFLEAWQRVGLPAIHGPVVTQLPRIHEEARRHLWRLLEDPSYRPSLGPSHENQIQTQAVRPDAASKGHGESGLVSGVTWGGNLTVLASLVGVLPPPPADPPRIAILEDVSEPPYRLDRALTQLALGGWLKGVRAAALGSVTAPDGADVSHVLAARLSELGIPCVRGFPWGHGTENWAVPLGLPADLDLTRKELRLLASPT